MFLTSSGHNKGPMTDWIVHFYCPKVPLSIGTTLGALGWLVLKSVFHTRGSDHPITLTGCGLCGVCGDCRADVVYFVIQMPVRMT